MPLKLKYKIPQDFILEADIGCFKIEIVNVSYRTTYDFIWHTENCIRELTAVIEAYHESKLELEVCLINSLIDDYRFHLAFLRIVATLQ